MSKAEETELRIFEGCKHPKLIDSYIEGVRDGKARSQLQALREEANAEKEAQLDKYKSAFVATDEEVFRWGQVKAFEKMEDLIDKRMED